MIEQIYLESVLKRFKEYKALGEKTFDQLTEAQMLLQPNEGSNSIAIIIQHLHGNMLSRWTNFLTEDGEKAGRNRDEEFEAHKASKTQLLQLWESGWAVLLKTLQSLQPGDLHKSITIRSEALNVIDAINRNLSHCSYHVGQMVYVGKWLKNEQWQSMSIPKGASQQYNQQMNKGK